LAGIATACIPSGALDAATSPGSEITAGTAIADGSCDRSVDHCTRLLRINQTPDVERRSLKKLVRIQLFKGSRIDQTRFHVARNRDHRGAFFPRVHQAIKQVSHAGTGCTTNGNRISGEVGLRNRGENAVLLIPHMNELNLSVPVERIDDGIQRAPHDSIAAFHARPLQHFPQHVHNS
jgi:hypothetical protein